MVPNSRVNVYVLVSDLHRVLKAMPGFVIESLRPVYSYVLLTPLC